MADQPQTTIRTYDPTTPEGLAFALLGCLDFGADGKSLPVFQASGIELIRGALAAERERCAKIARDRGLKSHKDFRWLAEEIEAEIEHGRPTADDLT